MFTHIIVGVDAGEGGRDAIALAERLRTDNTKLTLASVYVTEPIAWRGSSAAYDAAKREDAEKLLEQRREESGLEATLLVHGASSVGRGLHELAEHAKADLLVVGSSRRGLWGRVMLGDDTRESLSGAACSVAIAPIGYRNHPTLMREIGVGYDGSDESKRAVALARELASDHGAKLSAMKAVSMPVYVYAGAATPIEEALEETVENARQEIVALDGAEAHAVYGQPAEELALYSASLDLLVVGARDFGPFGRLVHGSTSRELARRAKCPLIVLARGVHDVHTGEGADTGTEAAPLITA